MNDTIRIYFEDYCVRRGFTAAQRDSRANEVIVRCKQVRNRSKAALARLIEKYYGIEAKSLRGANRRAMENAVVRYEHLRVGVNGEV